MQYSPYSNRVEVAKVRGRQGAEMFFLPPNSSILLLDEEAPIIWLKITNEIGYSALTPYDITLHIEEKEPTLSDVLKRLEKLEGMINEQSNNTTPDERATTDTNQESV